MWFFYMIHLLFMWFFSTWFIAFQMSFFHMIHWFSHMILPHNSLIFTWFFCMIHLFSQDSFPHDSLLFKCHPSTRFIDFHMWFFHMTLLLSCDSFPLDSFIFTWLFHMIHFFPNVSFFTCSACGLICTCDHNSWLDVFTWDHMCSFRA